MGRSADLADHASSRAPYSFIRPLLIAAGGHTTKLIIQICAGQAGQHSSAYRVRAQPWSFRGTVLDAAATCAIHMMFRGAGQQGASRDGAAVRSAVAEIHVVMIALCSNSDWNTYCGMGVAHGCGARCIAVGCTGPPRSSAQSHMRLLQRAVVNAACVYAAQMNRWVDRQ